MLHLFTSRAGSGTLEAVLSRLCAKPGKQILLVPEQFSHEAERALCRAGGPGACVDKEVLSFTRLARRVAESAGGGARPVLDAGGRVLLMYAAVQSVAEQLTVYRAPSRRPAFLTGLLATLDECKSYQVPPEALFRAGETLGGVRGDKLRDLGLIFSAYGALTGRTAADPRDTLTRLAEALDRSRWAAGRGFWVWGFTDFTPQQGEVLRLLLRDGENVSVCLTLDREDPDPSGVFAPAKRTAACLTRLAESAGTGVVESELFDGAGDMWGPPRDAPMDVSGVRRGAHCAPAVSQTQHVIGRAHDVRPYNAFTDASHPGNNVPSAHHNPSPALRHLERTLFSPVPDPWEGPCGVTVYTARDAREEAERAAAEILRLVQEEGYRFREIAVCARDFGPWSDLVESVFEKYGIPLFLSTVTDVLQKPILALVTGALAAAAGDYAYEDVFRYLKTGLTDIDPDDRDVLENYVLTWNLRGSRWTQAKDWDMHPAGYGQQMTPEDEALLARLNDLRKRVAAPLEALRKNRDRTGRGYALAMYQCLEDIGLPARLEERQDAFTRSGELKLAAEYSQLWDILCGALEQCSLLLDDTPMDLEAFSRLFSLTLSQYDVGSIPVSLDRVTAGDCPRMSGRTFRALFWLGADSGSVPQAAPNPGLLTDRDRAALSDLALDLAPRLEDKLEREMTIVYETCAVPTEVLWVSWARAGPEGEAAPSFLIGRLEAVFPDLAKRSGEGEEARLAAPRPALELAGQRPEVLAALKTLPAYREAAARQAHAAHWRRGRLSLDASRALYGATAPLSATRLDNLRACHFQHFLKYGLKAQPRQRAAFQATDYGTFVHAVLETVLRDAAAVPGGIRALHEDQDKRRAVTERAAQTYIDESLRGAEEDSGRLRYLFSRMKRAIHAVVDSAVAELAVSDFAPAAFELGFGAGKAMPPIRAGEELPVAVSGAVDRVDTWVHNGKRYLRVVDYKTGKKEFSFTDLASGRGLQMLLYLFALEHGGADLFGPEPEAGSLPEAGPLPEAPPLPVVPAGVLYFPARDPLVDGQRNMTAEEIDKKRTESLTRRGLVLGEEEVLSAMEHTTGGFRYLPVDKKGDFVVTEEQMEKLGAMVARSLEDAAAELAAGDIDADPFWRGPQENACRWCDYAAACHFEPGCGDKRRWQKGVSAKEFWEGLEE